MASVSTHAPVNRGIEPQPMATKWTFVVMVMVAIAISYFDRQTLPIAISAIQKSIPLSNLNFAWLQSAFLLAYALLYAGGGRLLDLLGTRRGFLIIMLWWSLACALHGLANSFGFLLIARFLLGMGEGGGFPAATRVVAEWVPMAKRSSAMGLINAGTSVGAVLAPPLIGAIILASNWRVVFFAAGAIGVAWVMWWWAAYPAANNHPKVSAQTADGTVTSWAALLKIRQVKIFVFAKFMSDAAWYFYLFWLPKYLYDARGFDVKQVSYYAWIPYAAAGFGSLLGGWFSSHLLARGKSLDFSRKLALGLSAALMPVVILITHVPVGWALVLFSIAFFGQQSWSGLIMTLPADIFPLASVGSVAGMIGFGGAIGGAVFGLFAGKLMSLGFGYSALFQIVGTFHVIAFISILLFGGRMVPFVPLNSPQREEAASL